VGSDRARISFDETREYRSVVAQQGRVTLEADVNEQATIASEALRLEIIDLVGPAGTPDNGYQIKWVNGMLAAGSGTMYLGGWRLELAREVLLAKQPEWVDQPAANMPLQAVIGLLATEQFISAIEDQPLREVALGGPDTSARSRLMQHLIAIATTQSTCTEAEAHIEKTLSGMGLVWHRKTAELKFDAKLQVSLFPPPTQSDPCSPPAQGGYLGADNQLVQVTVTQYDPNTKSGTLLWGWNDASFLYRAGLVNANANPQVLQLGQSPIDAEHTPQPNQAIEVLGTTMVLGGERDQNYIAAPQGQVITLGSGTIFDPTSNQLTLPAGTTLQPDLNTLFVRLWQAQVPFQSSQATNLDNISGLAVTVEITALPTNPFVTRPFWQFAVRPNTPQQVYPQRYLEVPQPPDGPRMWVCPLAEIKWNGALLTTLRDYRTQLEPFSHPLQVLQVIAKDAYGNDIVLRNGMELPAEGLAQGLRLILNHNVEPATVSDVGCFVSLDLPFPSSDADRKTWGDALIAYQRVILAAAVQTGCPDELLWTPFDDTRAFLLGHSLRDKTLRKIQRNFQKDWDVFDPTGSASSSWDYAGDGVTQTAIVGIGSSGTPGLGTIAVHKHRLGPNAFSISLTANTTGTQGDFGLVFDCTDGNNYLALLCRSFGTVISEGEDFVPAFAVTALRISGGQVQTLNNQESDGIDASFVSLVVHFDIQRTSKGLLCSVNLTPPMISPVAFIIDASQLPSGLLAQDSAVGMFSRFSGGLVTFTRLQIIDGDSGVTTLIPPGSEPAVAGLTLKRSFVQPQVSAALGPAPRNISLQPQPDFEQWFFLVPPQPVYGYGSGAALGAGLELV
jgi:hypothetical protein